MPLQSTSGAASYDAFGGGVAAVPKYIEDYFSTFLYSGTGSSQTINNGIDLATKGGLTWIKDRGAASTPHMWFDTNRGVGKYIQSNSIGAQGNIADTLTAFNSNGFTVGADSFGVVNASGHTYTSWSIAKAPKFFDVVTVSHTNGVDNTIDFSSLGTIGCVIIKRTDAAQNWYVWHRSLGNGYYGLFLNSTNAPSNFGTAPVSVSGTTVTMTDSSAVGSYFGTGSYVVYAYAHNAGGFGLTGTDNVISCGSFSCDGATNTVVSLGYEPQWIMIKLSNGADNWYMLDNMRGLAVNANQPELFANTSGAEATTGWFATPTATGFTIPTASNFNNPSQTYIYIAIRRGPMKVPTDATKVFSNNLETTSTNPQTLTTGFPVDLTISTLKTGAANRYAIDRLRGQSNALLADTTGAEFSSPGLNLQNNTALVDAGFWNTNGAIYWNFGRAPSFFDEVCYTGTGSATTQAHNLGVVPEMIIVKGRTNTFSWFVYQKDLTTANQSFLTLNTDSAVSTGSAVWNSTSPTSSVFSIGSANAINQSGQTYVAYLFATCAGVSKVGSYTGNGSTQTINCGFTGGARFVLIKRTDSTGDWYVYDTARGMTTLTDPYLLLNSTAAESATLGSVTTVSTGFAVNASILAAINTNGASYIYLSIA